MKRLIFFSKHMELGGLEKSLLNLLNRLNFDRYSVELVLEELHGPLLEQLDPRITVREYRLSNCKLVPLRKALNLAKRTLWTLTHKNKYDFACSYCTYSIIGSRLAQAASENSCLYVHNDYTTLYPDEGEFHSFFSQLRVDQFRKLLFVSNESKVNFIARLPETADKCDVINNIVEWEHIHTMAHAPCPIAPQPGMTTFLFLGRLEEQQKRMSRLLKAFQIARVSRKDIRLLMVGNGPERPLCEQLIKEYELSDCVTMTGSQTNPYPYLNLADCLVLSSDYEGFPVVYFEAMVLGKDIITTVPVSDEQVNVGAYATVTDKTPEALANALISYIPGDHTPLNMEALNRERINALDAVINGSK